ncbi:MAG: winged helix-turn-helix domain-containing protein [Rubrobacteraceae bacterium]
MSEERAHRVFEVSGGDFGGKLMVTRGTGRTVREALAEALEELPKGGVLYVDTRGVEMMDYSFADEALGILVSRVANREYGDRYLVLVEEDRDLLENVEASLRQRDLAMIRVEEVGAQPTVIGALKDHLLNTLNVVQETGSITTAQLAERLGVNHTACNNRATNLVKRGLIGRRTEAGGRQYTYERIA